ncbi:UDP-3-O-acyl-N-acetylglucosamine deacetylase [Candidatus Ecksteinia adelgidicola]|nr:UDP-3-O-acyl-N-acetylglucosamine deacetylase [Candidatus Ecksteinia adelgidicola]
MLRDKGMIKQRTLKKMIQTKGIGLHSGKKVTLIMYPSSMNTGIIYRRIDLNPPVVFPVNAKAVGSTILCTSLISKCHKRISTVEHLNAALSGLGIDNIIIEVNAPEIPIMDGSSKPFVFLLLNAGIKELNSSKKFLRLKRIVRVQIDDKWAELAPYNGFCLNFTIKFNHPVIHHSKQSCYFNFSSNSFIYQISSARTFGFIRDVKYLQSHGLALGGNINCAIVLDDNRILNKDGLRFKDEFVRHKILDAIGDLFMCGYNIIGAFTAYKSGHELNNKLLLTVLKKNAWEYVTFKNERKMPLNFKI